MTTEEKVSSPERRRSSVASRGNWGSRWEFLLSCIGLSVGIGNVWRFPYLAYQNGGGAFLVPYLIMLALVGKPLYFVELALGQFAGQGPLALWACCPIAKGVGFAMVAVCWIVVIYYNVIMSYCIFYLASTFQAVLPWTRCDLPWANGTNCTSRDMMENTTRADTPSHVYWRNYVLELSDGLDQPNGIKWDLVLCLLLGWIIVAVCLAKGIKTSGKVVYFAATFPYVVLITLLVAGLTQDGAVDGVLYFLVPTWDKLLDIHVWKEAAGQMFFSLSVSMGALIMYSSYNDFRNNIFRDAVIVTILDTSTSIISGMAIFSVLGAMTKDLGNGTNIEDVVSSGPGLAFVAYPEAVTRLPIPQLWSALFFLMLFILGLDSEFALLECILTSFCDELPILRRHRLKFCIGMCVCCFLLGLPCVTRGGQYVLELMDKFGGSTALVFIAIIESFAFGWLYGVNRVCDDIDFMLERRPGLYWKFTWWLTAPGILVFVFLYSTLTSPPLFYGDYEYPGWATYIGWTVAAIPMVQVPLWAIIAVLQQKGPGLSKKLRQAIQPSEKWGPNDPSIREEWKKRTSEPVPQVAFIHCKKVPDTYDNLTFYKGT